VREQLSLLCERLREFLPEQWTDICEGVGYPPRLSLIKVEGQRETTYRAIVSFPAPNHPNTIPLQFSGLDNQPGWVDNKDVELLLLPKEKEIVWYNFPALRDYLKEGLRDGKKWHTERVSEGPARGYWAYVPESWVPSRVARKALRTTAGEEPCGDVGGSGAGEQGDAPAEGDGVHRGSQEERHIPRTKPLPLLWPTDTE